MELQEYQVKPLLARFGIKSPSYVVVDSRADYKELEKSVGGDSFIIRPQTEGSLEIICTAEKLKETLESCFSTPGVRRVTVMQNVVDLPLYSLSIGIDWSGDVVLSACRPGKKPVFEKLFDGSLRPFQINRLAASLSLRENLLDRFLKIVRSIVQIFFQYDVLLLQLNPLALMDNGLFQVLNARMICDDRALYRQPELLQMAENSAKKPISFEYPRMMFRGIGHIACGANGPALALALSDACAASRASVGQVLDFGADFSRSALEKGIRSLTGARALLLHVFTGVHDCEKIAREISTLSAPCPIIVYIEGTNEAAGRRVIDSMKPKFMAANSLDNAIEIALEYK